MTDVVHPHYEQFLQHQEAAERERAEAFKNYKTGIEQLAAEGRLEEQFSAEEAQQILSELGEVESVEVTPVVEPVKTTVPDEVVAAADELQVQVDEANEQVEQLLDAEPGEQAEIAADLQEKAEAIDEAIAEVEVTAEEIQADLDHGTNDEPAEEAPAEEPEADPKVEEKPAPKKRTTKAKTKKADE